MTQVTMTTSLTSSQQKSCTVTSAIFYWSYRPMLTDYKRVLHKDVATRKREHWKVKLEAFYPQGLLAPSVSCLSHMQYTIYSPPPKASKDLIPLVRDCPLKLIRSPIFFNWKFLRDTTLSLFKVLTNFIFIYTMLWIK